MEDKLLSRHLFLVEPLKQGGTLCITTVSDRKMADCFLMKLSLTNMCFHIRAKNMQGGTTMVRFNVVNLLIQHTNSAVVL